MRLLITGPLAVLAVWFLVKDADRDNDDYLQLGLGLMAVIVIITLL